MSQQAAQPTRIALPAGDYAVQATDGTVLAAVKRKSLDDLAAALADGTLAFQLQRLSELPLAAVVVEARYSALYKLEHVDGSWLADQLARLEVRYPEVHLVFTDSRCFAEEWTYRFLSSALRHLRPEPGQLRRIHVDRCRAPIRSRESACIGVLDPYTCAPSRACGARLLRWVACPTVAPGRTSTKGDV